MVDEHKTQINWTLITFVGFLVLVFTIASYYFSSRFEVKKNRAIATAEQACQARVIANKAELIGLCDRGKSTDEKNQCVERKENELTYLDNVCPREIKALSTSYCTAKNQVRPFFYAALITILVWMLGYGGRRMYLKHANKQNFSFGSEAVM